MNEEHIEAVSRHYALEVLGGADFITEPEAVEQISGDFASGILYVIDNPKEFGLTYLV